MKPTKRDVENEQGKLDKELDKFKDGISEMRFGGMNEGQRSRSLGLLKATRELVEKTRENIVQNIERGE